MDKALKKKIRQRAMVEGPIFKTLLLFALPIAATSLLTRFFHAADIAVLSIMVNGDAVAAVGATGSLVSLINCLFIGLASGTGVVLSRYVGAKDEENCSRTVGTAFWVGIISGIIVALVGLFGSRTFLQLMGCPSNIIEDSIVYLRIMFLGAPITMLYNFSASMLRAVGDSKRPLIYLAVAGCINIGLNVFCVAVLNLTVQGVAIATIASNGVACLLAFIAILRTDGYGKLKKKYFKIYPEQLKKILVIGLPTGIQSGCFDLANTVVQATANSFGSIVVAGSSLASQLDSTGYTFGHAISLGCMTMISQNIGAGKYNRVKKTIWSGLGIGFFGALIIGVILVVGADFFLGLLSNESPVIAVAKVKLQMLGIAYSLCAIMNILEFCIIGMGKSFISMVISLFGGCVLRITYLKLVFPYFGTIQAMYLAWPITWVITILIFVSVFFFVLNKVKKEIKANNLQRQE